MIFNPTAPAVLCRYACLLTVPLLLSASVLAADAPAPTSAPAGGKDSKVLLNIPFTNAPAASDTKNAAVGASNAPVAKAAVPAATAVTPLAATGSAPIRSNTPPAAAKRTGPVTYETFAIIPARNIFFPDRRALRPTDGPPPKPPVQVDTFALVGVMSYEKGQFAFFDGSSSGFRQALKVGGKIDTYTVTEITNNKVKLDSGKTNLDFTIGMQMRREDKGEWKLGIRTDTYASSSSGSSSSTSSTSSSDSGSSGGGGDSILERLRKKREAEAAAGK